MNKRHNPRRPQISGRNGLRNLARDLADSRTHWNFTERLSGYNDAGRPSGPYTGVRLLRENEPHLANDDDQSADFAGCFAKGLKHAMLDAGGKGLVDPAAYRTFQDTLIKVVNEGRDDLTLATPDPVATSTVLQRIDQLGASAMDKPGAIAASQMPNGIAATGRPLVNPLAGIATSLDGLDPMDITIPPAPALKSRWAATELLELYWMAKVRDLPFDRWGNEQVVADAAMELDDWNGKTFDKENVWFAQFSTAAAGRPGWDAAITPQRLFRGSAPGVAEGHYLSVFLRADVPFGTLMFEQNQYPLRTDKDYMLDPNEWWEVQIGAQRRATRSDLEDDQAPKLPITTLRHLAHYVHFDALHEAYFNAALILDRAGAQLNDANAYLASDVIRVGDDTLDRRAIHEGFGTFGGPHILVLLTEVATRALKAVWHQKWMVHRRLRPEVMGARLHSDVNWGSSFLHPDLKTANGVKPALADNYLLPMAFPEGSPMHPSYGAGHATVAGACATILKAMFDTRQPMADLKLPRLATPGATSNTVEGEINKLAANIAIGRNGAGVHYRTDYTKSLVLGEAVAAAVLQEKASTFADVDPDRVFTFPTFDGQWVCIGATGKLTRCPEPQRNAEAAVRQLRDKSLFQQ